MTILISLSKHTFRIQQSFAIAPNGPLSVVAWNYGKPNLEIRVYSVVASNKLVEMVYVKDQGGWDRVQKIQEEVVLSSGAKLSGIAAVRTSDDGQITVYYQPTPKVIGEYHVNAGRRVPLGIPTTGFSVAEIKVQEAEQRKREEERKRKEEADRIQAEKKRKEEAEKKRKEEEAVRQAAVEKQRQEEAARQAAMEKQRQEEAARQAAVEKQRQEEAARVRAMEIAKKQQEEAKVQAKIQNLGVCVAGYAWIQEAGGYRCAGGSHFLSNAQLGI